MSQRLEAAAVARKQLKGPLEFRVPWRGFARYGPVLGEVGTKFLSQTNWGFRAQSGFKCCLGPWKNNGELSSFCVTHSHCCGCLCASLCCMVLKLCHQTVQGRKLSAGYCEFISSKCNLDWMCQIASTHFRLFGYTQQSLVFGPKLNTIGFSIVEKTDLEWNMMSPAASWFDNQFSLEGSQPPHQCVSLPKGPIQSYTEVREIYKRGL